MKVGTRKAIAVWTIPLIGVIYGLVLGTNYQDARLMGMIRRLVGLVLLLALLVWCHSDAERRQYRIGRWTLFGLIFLPWIAFPYYLVASRGAGGWKTLSLSVCLLAAACLGAMVCAVMVGGWPYLAKLAPWLGEP